MYNSYVRDPITGEFVRNPSAKKDHNQPTSGGVSNWDDLQNKPFYETVKKVALHETQEYYQEYDKEAKSNRLCTIHPNFTGYKVGDEIEVIIDGTSYFSTIKDCFGNGSQPYYIGNRSLLQENHEDTGEPFIYDQTLEGVSVDTTVFFGGKHSFGMYKRSVEVKTIEEKYIPHSIARKNNISWNDLKDNPFGVVKQKGTAIVGNKTIDVPNQVLGYIDSPITLGSTYYVDFDGSEYECVAIENGTMNYGGAKIAIGDPDLVSYPFYIFQERDQYGCYDLECLYAGSGSHVVSVYDADEAVSNLADKFIPASIQRTGDPVYLTDASGVKWILSVSVDGTVSATKAE